MVFNSWSCPRECAGNSYLSVDEVLENLEKGTYWDF